MTAEHASAELWGYLLVWPILFVFLFNLHSRGGRLGGCLVYAYLISLIVIHFFGALVYASPGQQFIDTESTIIGFKETTMAVVAMAIGTIVVSGSRRHRVSSSLRWEEDELHRVARVFIVIGAGCWIAFHTPIAQLPSATSILSAGKNFAVLGLCVMCWHARKQGSALRFALWLACSAIFPLITIISDGFVGYGIAMMTTVVAFVAMFYRPRWHLIFGLIIAAYAGLSFWVAYAENRGAVRAAVWGGQSLETRFDALSKVFISIEPFDFLNQDHLAMVDARLNQNILVGDAIHYTPSVIPFRNGETLIAAVAAIIPRAIWPDKPDVGGSGQYVSEHTQTPFAEGTSVGMGQVLEFYINFGTIGVIIGFLLMGMVLRYMDIRLAEGLYTGDWGKVLVYFLAGAGALQPGGSMTEIMSSMVAGVALGLTTAHLVRQQRRVRTRPSMNSSRANVSRHPK